MQTFNEAFEILTNQVYERGFPVNTRLGPARNMKGVNTTYRWDHQIPDHVNVDFAYSFAQAVVNGDTNCDNVVGMSDRARSFTIVPTDVGLPANFSVMYGPRYVQQRQFVLDELNNNPNTRRAYVSIIGPEDFQITQNPACDHLEFPCTIGWSFYVHGLNLYVHSLMRSQNLWTIWPLDAIVLEHVAEDIASELNQPIDDIVYSVTMLDAHIYERDIKAWLKG